MPDTIPSYEAIRLSNALGNLEGAALGIEAVANASDEALVALARAVSSRIQTVLSADIFGSLSRNDLKAIVRAAARAGVPVPIVEKILAQKEGANHA